jgi:hypothetical protein
MPRRAPVSERCAIYRDETMACNHHHISNGVALSTLQPSFYPRRVGPPSAWPFEITISVWRRGRAELLRLRLPWPCSSIRRARLAAQESSCSLHMTKNEGGQSGQSWGTSLRRLRTSRRWICPWSRSSDVLEQPVNPLAMYRPLQRRTVSRLLPTAAAIADSIASHVFAVY